MGFTYDPHNTTIKYFSDTGGYMLLSHDAHGRPQTREVRGITNTLIKHIGSKNLPVTDAMKALAEANALHGVQLHNEIEAAINSGGAVAPKSPEAILAWNSFRAKYPSSQWTYQTEVPISDFNKYASQADIVAVNKQSGDIHIIDMKTGREQQGLHRVQLSMYKRMYETTFPGSHVSNLSILNVSRNPSKVGSFANYTPTTDKYLNRIFYSPISSRKIVSQDKIDTYAVTHLKNDVLKNLPAASSVTRTGSRPITVLDIETGHQQEIVAISAVKIAQNPVTQAWERIDTYKRYYIPRNTHSQEWHMAAAVHGLTREKLVALRAGAKYSKHYDNNEWADLKHFIGGGMVGGFNSVDFDLPLLEKKYGSLGASGHIDAYVAARNISKYLPDLFGKHDLDSVYQDLFGKTMQAAGLSHHDPMSDAIAAAQIISVMSKSKTSTGASIRYIMQHEGTSLGELDELLGSEVVIGNGANLAQEAYVSNPTIEQINELRHLAHNTDAEGNPVNNGFGIEDLRNMSGGESFGTIRVGELKEVLQSLQENQLAMNGGMIQDMTRAADSVHDALAGSNSLKAMSLRMKAGQRAALYGDPIKGYEYFASAMKLGGAQNVTGVDKAAIDEIMSQTQADRAEKVRLSDKAQKELEHTRNVRQATRALSRGLITQSQYDTDLSSSALYMDRDTFKEHMSDVAGDNQRYARNEHKVQRAFDKGYINEKQYTELNTHLSDSYEDLSEHLSDIIEKNERWNSALKQMQGIRMYDPMHIAQTNASQLQGITSSAGGFIPAPLLKPISYYTSAIGNQSLASAAYPSAGSHLWNSIAIPSITALGAIFGGAPGALITGGVASAIGGASQIGGSLKNARIMQAGESLQSTFNIMSGTVQLILAPIQLLTKAIKTVTGILGTISGTMFSGLNSMGQLGVPLTGLTGVHYGDYQKYGMMDNLAGFSRGTINSSIESFGSQQRLLYTLGQMDRNRVVASSMLGVFGSVYASSGNPKDSFASTVDTIYNRYRNSSPQEKQNILALSASVDKYLPQLIQVMDSVNAKSFNDYANPGAHGVFIRPINDKEVSGFRKDYYEYQGNLMSIDNSRQRISHLLWNMFGRNLMGGLNKALDQLSYGLNVDNVTKAFKILKDTLVNSWGDLKNIVFGDRNFDVKGWALSKFKDLTTSLIASWDTDAFTKKLTGLLDTVLNYAYDKLSWVFNYIKGIKLSSIYDVLQGKSLITHTGDNFSSVVNGTKLSGTERNALANVLVEDAKGHVIDASVSPMKGADMVSGIKTVSQLGDLFQKRVFNQGYTADLLLGNYSYHVTNYDDLARALNAARYIQEYGNTPETLANLVAKGYISQDDYNHAYPVINQKKGVIGTVDKAMSTISTIASGFVESVATPNTKVSAAKVDINISNNGKPASTISVGADGSIEVRNAPNTNGFMKFVQMSATAGGSR